MILRDDDRPIRIRPHKPRAAPRERAGFSGAYRLIMHYARGMRRLGKVSGPLRAHVGGIKLCQQRCAVRVTYLNNRMPGQWKAHGRYLTRESATASNTNSRGFNRDGSGIEIVRELERWQSSGDPRLWKVILSPEFGDRVDLQRLTRDLVEQMSADLGADLEWLAVAHYNTQHPHVHMVIRGVANDGQPLHLRREYLKHGIRAIAEDICTRQIGYRTAHDAAEAERREIGEQRFTSLDRAILGETPRIAVEPDSSDFILAINFSESGRTDAAQRRMKLMAARLAVLQRMGLAELTGTNTWRVRRDFEQVLRAMQRTSDRQKTLAAHGTPVSDQRLPIAVLDIDKLTTVQGRIIVHGQDEQTGSNYLMLEGIDAKIHFMQYTTEMEVLRAEGGLRTNSFLRLRRFSSNGRRLLDVQDLGDSEKLLNSRTLLGENARVLLRQGIIPTEDGWGGWLGRYQAALVRIASEIRDRELRLGERTRRQGRGR